MSEIFNGGETYSTKTETGTLRIPARNEDQLIDPNWSPDNEATIEYALEFSLQVPSDGPLYFGGAEAILQHIHQINAEDPDREVHVLDIGCSTARFAQLLSDLNYKFSKKGAKDDRNRPIWDRDPAKIAKYTGVDINRETLKMAAKNIGESSRRPNFDVNLKHIPTDKSYIEAGVRDVDVAIMAFVDPVIPTVDGLNSIFENLSQVMRPGGKLVLLRLNATSFRAAQDAYKFYSRKEINENGINHQQSLIDPGTTFTHTISVINPDGTLSSFQLEDHYYSLDTLHVKLTSNGFSRPNEILIASNLTNGIGAAVKQGFTYLAKKFRRDFVKRYDYADDEKTIVDSISNWAEWGGDGSPLYQIVTTKYIGNGGEQ